MNRGYQSFVAFFLCTSLLFAVGSVQARELNAQTNVDQATHSVDAADTRAYCAGHCTA